MSTRSPLPGPTAWICALALLALSVPGAQLLAQSGPSPYRTVDDWAKLPNGRQMGAVGKVTTDPDGDHIWAVIRCDAGGDRFGTECLDSDLDPVVKFDLDGNVVESFGGGMFIWPHGIDVDSDGNVWVTDAVATANIPAGDERGHQVIKFSSTGRVLMTLGTPGKPGVGNNSFNAPADVVVADNGDIFVADGHGNDTNNRIVKFSKDGTFIKAWGQKGVGPGEFATPHSLAFDSRGRLFVGDRENNRIQLFTQDGTFLEEWTQFGRPSGMWIDENDVIYVADYQLREGIVIANADDFSEIGFISEASAEGVVVDAAGNVYAGEVLSRNLKKFVRNER